MVKNISVIIPTLNRYNYLNNVLYQLNQQSVSPMEVIVIDQTPKCDMVKIDPDRFPALYIKYLCLDNPGQCSARNKGIEIASGDYILFCDDDNELPKDFIEKHIDNISSFKKPVCVFVLDIFICKNIFCFLLIFSEHRLIFLSSLNLETDCITS